jgi:hypothetical protein
MLEHGLAGPVEQSEYQRPSAGGCIQRLQVRTSLRSQRCPSRVAASSVRTSRPTAALAFEDGENRPFCLLTPCAVLPPSLRNDITAYEDRVREEARKYPPV